MKRYINAALIALLVTITGCVTQAPAPIVQAHSAPPAPPTLPARKMALSRTVAPTTASVSMAWNVSADAAVTGYTIYQGTNSGAYGTNFDAGTNLTFTASNLVRGVTYFFTVTAYEPGLESSYANEISYLVPSMPVPPGSLRFITIKPLTSLSTGGTWTAKTTPLTVAATDKSGFFRLQTAGTNVTTQMSAALTGPWQPLTSLSFTLANPDDHLRLDIR